MTAVIGAVAHHSADIRRKAHSSADLARSQKNGATAPITRAPRNLSIQAG